MTLSPGPVALAAIFIWGIVTHVALYGWQPAPVGSVRLSKRHWLTYVAIILPLALTIAALFVFRQPALDRFGSENVQSVLFELVTIGGMTIGRATYQPGWKWSVDVGPIVGATRCRVEHLGLVLQGRAVAAFDDDRIWELTPGSLFHIPAEPHDSWVVGDEPYVSLHFLGASHYAK